MAKEMKVKSIAFNLTDPFEQKLFMHTKQFNVFSAYIKRLIQRDLEGASFVNFVPATQNAYDYDFDGNGFI